MFKRIDLLLIRSFIPPLVTWSLVAMFVFNMQFLWKYIDEIIGKGLDLFVIFELLLYQALAMVPKSLLFGVVIASVMTLGNLAEHYELVSMKSAGISLLRILRPLALVCTGIAFASYMFSNHIIPVAALKFKARLHDIRRQKPALNLEPGKFNNDFRSVVIYIGEKSGGGNELKDVKIYDHSSGLGTINQTNAQHGRLSYSEDKRYLILRLKDGERQEDAKPNPKQPETYPYMRMSFKEFTALFDMSEFQFGRTNEEVFSRHHSFLTTRQLLHAMDSLESQKGLMLDDFRRGTENLFHFRRRIHQQQQEGRAMPEDLIPFDSLRGRPSPTTLKRLAELADSLGVDTSSVLSRIERRGGRYFESVVDLNYDPAKDQTPLIEVERLGYLTPRALGMVRNLREQAINTHRTLKRYEDNKIEHENEIHQKWLHALACLLFLFIGGSMGAIIRKGGFGWPILVSFIFFMIFFIFGLIGEHLAKSATLPCWLGSWLPFFILLPVAVLLSYEAINDRRILSWERFIQWWSKRRQKLKTA